jgi:hypothetical protein
MFICSVTKYVLVKCLILVAGLPTWGKDFDQFTDVQFLICGKKIANGCLPQNLGNYMLCEIYSLYCVLAIWV